MVLLLLNQAKSGTKFFSLFFRVFSAHSNTQNSHSLNPDLIHEAGYSQPCKEAVNSSINQYLNINNPVNSLFIKSGYSYSKAPAGIIFHTTNRHIITIQLF